MLGLISNLRVKCLKWIFPVIDPYPANVENMVSF